jgi:lipoprotein-anchoring transpeptidase ErfK/SrfK
MSRSKRIAMLISIAVVAISLGAIAPAVAHVQSAPAFVGISPGGSAVGTSLAPSTSSVEPTAPVDTRPKAPSFVPKKGKAIYINRRKQRVYLYVDGRQIDTFLCSTSRTLPRAGTYHYTKHRRVGSGIGGTVVDYYQTIFTVGPHGHNIAIHSIPVDHHGHEIAPVGKPVSHGCVRVKLAKAKFIYYWITKKTPIIVHAK